MSGYASTSFSVRRRRGVKDGGGFGQNGLMCGQYVMSKATGDLLSAFEAKEVEGTPPPPSWNVAPT